MDVLISSIVSTALTLANKFEHIGLSLVETLAQPLFFARIRRNLYLKYSGIGGQAVIEGIMMKNGDDYATAVRKPDGTIEVKKDTDVSLQKR